MKEKLAVLPKIYAMYDNIFDPVWAEFHISGKFELLHVIAGRFELTYADGRRFPAKAGDTLLVPPGTSHSDNFEPGDELEIFIVQFDWTAEAEIVRRHCNGWLHRQEPADRRKLRHFFDLLRFEGDSGELALALAESVLLSILLILYRAALPAATETEIAADAGQRPQHRQLVLRAQKYLRRNFRRPVRLAEVAEYLQVSPFHLSRVFSRESDFSFFDYLLELRLSEARRLLAEGRHRVSEVAAAVGYEDSGYFSKVFKLKAGCTPGEFAERARLKGE